jgi:hypothetical protein
LPVIREDAMPQDLPIYLAQAEPFDEASFGDSGDAPPPAPPARPAKPMTFSDLQGAMHDYSTGKNVDNTFRNGSLVILAVIGVVVMAIHLRQKYKNAAPPESVGKLGRELARLVRFPLGTRMLLWWVAVSSKVPFASLLLSSTLFDRCVRDWSRGHTFALLRGWGKSRLEKLKPVLFEQNTA